MIVKGLQYRNLRNNKLKKKIASHYVTDKNTVLILRKSIEDIEKFEYALNLSCNIINHERLHQFQMLACDTNLLKSKQYKQALNVFIKYTNPKNSKKIKCILSEPILINSQFYPAVLKLLTINNNTDYTIDVIYNILVDNFFHITPSFFNNLIYFNESTNMEIVSILKKPLINKEKVLDILTKLSQNSDLNVVEKNIEKVLCLIRRILFLEDKIAIKEVLNFLYSQTDNVNNNIEDKLQNKIVEQRSEIAKRKSLK